MSATSDGLDYPAATFAVLGPISVPDVDSESLWFSGISAEVTSFGSQMLGDVYPEGTLLAPVAMKLPRDGWPSRPMVSLVSSSRDTIC